MKVFILNIKILLMVKNKVMKKQITQKFCYKNNSQKFFFQMSNKYYGFFRYCMNIMCID